jgi:hypothetical protein
MQNLLPVLLMADTANGVQVVSCEDHADGDRINPRDFIEQLSTLSDDEVIYTQVMPEGTDGIWEEINESYGIH